MSLEITRTLRLGRSAPMAARHAVEGLSGGLSPRASERLRLVISELVTNAVLHSGLPEGAPIKILVRVARSGAQVQVVHAVGRSDEVPLGGVAAGSTSLAGERTDASATLGLQIVDRLCREWGVERGDEVRVWARIPLKER